jgi:polysaccharide export outer membrane protein
MRVTRSLLLLFAVASAAAGCAQQSVMRVQMAPAPQGIDNVIYGSVQPAYGAVAAPAYAMAPAPTYASTAAPAYGSIATTGPVRGLPAGLAFGGRVVAAPVSYASAPAPYSTPSYAQAPYAPVSYAPASYASAYAPWTQQSTYTLDSGDRLRIVVFGQDGLTNSYVLDASGQIAMPLIGTVAARGLTTDQLSARLADLLRQGFIRDPHVAVEIEAYRPFFILGEVTAPGQYPYSPNMTVETAVAIAGGFGPRGSHKTVVISRNFGGQVYRFEAPVSFQIRPGDTIQVQERWF